MSKRIDKISLIIAVIAGFVGGAFSNRIFRTEPVLAAGSGNKPEVKRFDEVRAARFIVVDKNNKPVARLGFNDSGTVPILIMDYSDGNIYLGPGGGNATAAKFLQITDKKGNILELGSAVDGNMRLLLQSVGKSFNFKSDFEQWALNKFEQKNLLQNSLMFQSNATTEQANLLYKITRCTKEFLLASGNKFCEGPHCKYTPVGCTADNYLGWFNEYETKYLKK